MSQDSNSEDTDLVVDPKSNSIQLRNFQQVWKLSSLLVKSDLFGTSNTNEVATKVITGLEMGISPVRAVRHIDTIDGKPSVSAQLSAAMLQMSENFDYHVDKVDVDFDDDGNVLDGIARVCISKNGEKQGCAEFTWNEAIAANLTWKDNWEKYPRDMLFARAMKRAKKWYAPSVGIGREYMPDELGKEDNPTVQVPSEVANKAQSEDTSTNTNGDTVSSGPSDIVDADFEVDDEPESDTVAEGTKKVQEEINKSESEDSSDSDGGFQMEVTSDVDNENNSKSESESVAPKGDNLTTQPRPKGSSKSKDESKGTGPDEEDDATKWGEFTKYVDKIDDSLSDLEGLALRNKVGEYHYRINNLEEEAKYNLGMEMIEKHIGRIDMPYNRERAQVSPPTQQIINGEDADLQSLKLDDLESKIGDVEQELEEWSEPAKSVFQSVVDRHKNRLKAQRESEPESNSKGNTNTSGGVNHKAQVAEFNESLSTALTKLGMKLNDSHKPQPLDNLLDALNKKVESFGPEGYPTEEMLEEYRQAIAPYKRIIRMRYAVVEGEVDPEHFSDVVQSFGKKLRDWDDREKAQRAHDLIENEAKRLEENVDGFYLQWE